MAERRFKSLIGLSAIFILIEVASSLAAGPRPAFQIPFSCGERWYATTYTNHNAIDWNETPTDQNGDVGEEVVASFRGTASRGSQFDPDGFGWGYYVLIDHGNGWQTRYAHLQQSGRATGRVTQGQRIGFLGNSGTDPNGAHLHWEQIKDGVQTSTLFANGSAVGVDRYHVSRNCNSLVSSGNRLRGKWDIEIAPDGQVRLLGIKKDGTLLTRFTSGGEWSGFKQHGKSASWTGGDIEIGPDGQVRLLGIKKSGTMYTRFTSGGEWSGFRQHDDAGSWAGGDIEIAPDGQVRLLGIKKDGTLLTRFTSGGEWSGFKQHGDAGIWATK